MNNPCPEKNHRSSCGPTVIISCLAMLFSFAAFPVHASLRDKIKELTVRQTGSAEPDSATIISGLKEALSIGARNGVTTVSAANGYFGNPLIRIPIPDKIQKIEHLLRKAGMHKEVDSFLLSMNRAAEKAAPRALQFFVAAVRDMSIPDAVNILRGNDTAATHYLRQKTFASISMDFKPVVSSVMNEVGVTKAFKEMMNKARSIPLLKKETVDLDEYVTTKALDGLFTVVGQEEKKIRKDPAARVTDLLKTVFKT